MARPFSAPASSFFSASYPLARTRFLEAAQRAGAIHQAFAHPQAADLFCDAAIVPHDSLYALITLSGTHGIEGYYGSAIQRSLLEYNADAALASLFQIHIHGLNAWGMQHFSRTNEAQVDINRNGIDFSQPLPVNALYPLVHEYLCFRDWEEHNLSRFWNFREQFIQTHGLTPWNRAYSGGQYTTPDAAASTIPTYHTAYPSAGGIHELEFYLMVRLCDGLPAGIYAYDDRQHILRRLPGVAPYAEHFITNAAYQWGRPDHLPQMVVLITSRLEQLAWKYESIAYRLTLLNAGCAAQTLQLVSAGLGTACCVLGGINSMLMELLDQFGEIQGVPLVQIAIGAAATADA